MTLEASIVEYRAYKPSDSPAVERLFVSVFSESEGEREGALIGNLVRELIASTDSRDLYGFVAVSEEQVVGALFFSRLTFDRDIDAFILAPVAVQTERQGMGIGQASIAYGLREMKKKSVKFAIVYGDPSFYSKVGFHPISQATIQAPFELSRPEGWLGRSLADDPIEAIPGRCSCVKALDDPAYW